MDANPLDSINALKGQLWKKLIRKDELQEYQSKFKVISSRLSTGQMQITVQSPDLPDDTFNPKDPDLSDVYFSTIPADEII